MLMSVVCEPPNPLIVRVTGRSSPTKYLVLSAMQAVHRLSMPIRVESVSNRVCTADCSLWFWCAMMTILAMASAPASPFVRPGFGPGPRSVQVVYCHQTIHRFRARCCPSSLRAIERTFSYWRVRLLRLGPIQCRIIRVAASAPSFIQWRSRPNLRAHTVLLFGTYCGVAAGANISLTLSFTLITRPTAAMAMTRKSQGRTSGSGSADVGISER